MTIKTKGVLTYYLDAKGWGWRPSLARKYAVEMYARHNNKLRTEVEGVLEDVLKSNSKIREVSSLIYKKSIV